MRSLSGAVTFNSRLCRAQYYYYFISLDSRALFDQIKWTSVGPGSRIPIPNIKSPILCFLSLTRLILPARLHLFSPM